jgi:TonB family protein
VSVSVNAVTRGLGPKFVPPAALREVRPEVPPNLQSRLSRDVQMVRVKVYVDRAGNVQFAELLSNGTGDNRELASLAVFAARGWQFAPASRDGKPVDAQAVLRFRFGPKAE